MDSPNLFVVCQQLLLRSAVRLQKSLHEADPAGRQTKEARMTYFQDEDLSEDEMMFLDVAIAGYEEECRAWRALEEELDDLQCEGAFR